MPMPNNEGKQKYIVTVTVQCNAVLVVKTLTVWGPTEVDWCVMFSQAGTLFSWPPLLHCLLWGASLVVCVWSPTYRQEHLALSLSGYLWMVLAGRRGMCAHSGYFKICQCAPVGLVEEFCCGCHLDITSPVSAGDLISHYAALHWRHTVCSGLALLFLPLHC